MEVIDGNVHRCETEITKEVYKIEGLRELVRRPLSLIPLLEFWSLSRTFSTLTGVMVGIWMLVVGRIVPFLACPSFPILVGFGHNEEDPR